MTKKTSTIITTFGGDIYIIEGMTPDEVDAMVAGMDNVRMPNGAHINPKAIATKQSYEDYTFQIDQKNRHKKGQYLHRGEWHDQHGSLGISAHLERITGEIKTALPAGNKKLKGHE